MDVRLLGLLLVLCFACPLLPGAADSPLGGDRTNQSHLSSGGARVEGLDAQPPPLVSGVVVWDGGSAPAKGAVVRLEVGHERLHRLGVRPEVASEVVPAPDGRFQIQMPRWPVVGEQFSVKVVAPGYVCTAGWIDRDLALDFAAKAGQRIELYPQEIQGKAPLAVLKPDGSPVVNAIAALNVEFSGRYYSNWGIRFGVLPLENWIVLDPEPDGTLAIPNLGTGNRKLRYEVAVVAPGHPITVRDFRETELVVPLSVTLREVDATIEGRVLEEDGSPVRGALVGAVVERVSSTSTPSGNGPYRTRHYLERNAQAETGANGSFRLQAEAGKIQMRVRGPEAPWVVVPKVVDAAAGERKTIDVVLPGKVDLVVSVRDGLTGAPIPGAEVRLLEPDRQLLESRRDPDWADELPREKSTFALTRQTAIGDAEGNVVFPGLRTGQEIHLAVKTADGLVPDGSMDGVVCVGRLERSKQHRVLELFRERSVRLRLGRGWESDRLSGVSLRVATGSVEKSAFWETSKLLPLADAMELRVPSSTRLRIRALRYPNAQFTFEETIPVGEGVHELEVSPQRLGKVSGLVKTSDGSPASNLHLKIRPRVIRQLDPPPFPLGSHSEGTRTRPSGEFEFPGIPPGEYILYAESSGEGLHIPRHEFRLEPGEDVAGLEILASRGRIIRGRVTNQDGKGIPGAVIRALLSGSYEMSGRAGQAVSGEDGSFELSGLNPDHLSGSLTCRHSEHANQWTRIEASRDTYDFRLEPPGSVLLRVIDGTTGAEAKTYAFRPSNSRVVTSQYPPGKVLNGGPVRIDGLIDLELDLAVEICGPNGEPTGRFAEKKFQFESIPRDERIDLVVDPPGVITGIVKFLPGEGSRAGITVIATRRLTIEERYSENPKLERDSYSAVTDESGNFTLNGLVPGEYDVRAEPFAGCASSRGYARFGQRPTTDPIELFMVPGGPLKVRATRPSGAPVPNLPAAARVANQVAGTLLSNPWTWSGVTDASGEIVLDPCPYGFITIMFGIGGVGARNCEVHVSREHTPEDDSTFEFVVRDIVPFRMEVTVQGGEPLDDRLDLTMSFCGGYVQMWGSKIGGKLVFEGMLPEGEYNAWLWGMELSHRIREPITIKASDPPEPVMLDIPAGRAVFRLPAEADESTHWHGSFTSRDETLPLVLNGFFQVGSDAIVREQFPAGDWLLEMRATNKSNTPLATANFTVTPGCDIEVPLVLAVQ